MTTTRTLLYASVFAGIVAAPALAGGLLGGAVGGTLNGSLGGFGATGALGATTHIAPRVTNPPLHAPAVAVPQVAVPATPSLSQVTTTVTAPAIPDVELRRTAIIGAGIAPVSYADVPVYVDQQYIVLQHDLAGTGVRVEKRGEQIVLEMPSDVTFAFNKYDIQPRFYGVLNAVSRTLAKYPATYVDVNGHTDAIGSYAYNQVLSERRADTVADFLADRAVQPARMHVQGFGKTEPIASNATIEGRAANRRVEIILTPYTS